MLERVVEVSAFHPDENNDEWISYMLIPDLVDDPVTVGEVFLIVTPGAARYADVTEYDSMYSNYRVHYTSDNLPELA